jgi:hypothetical protein
VLKNRTLSRKPDRRLMSPCGVRMVSVRVVDFHGTAVYAF